MSEPGAHLVSTMSRTVSTRSPLRSGMTCDELAGDRALSDAS